MLALLLCKDRECRAAFEVEGTPKELDAINCMDCGGPLRAVGYADADPGRRGPHDKPDVRRAA